MFLVFQPVETVLGLGLSCHIGLSVRPSASKVTTKMIPGYTGLDSAVPWRSNGPVRRQTPGDFYGMGCRLCLGCGQLSFDALTFATLMSVSFFDVFQVLGSSVFQLCKSSGQSFGCGEDQLQDDFGLVFEASWRCSRSSPFLSDCGPVLTCSWGVETGCHAGEQCAGRQVLPPDLPQNWWQGAGQDGSPPRRRLQCPATAEGAGKGANHSSHSKSFPAPWWKPAHGMSLGKVNNSGATSHGPTSLSHTRHGALLPRHGRASLTTQDQGQAQAPGPGAAASRAQPHQWGDSLQRCGQKFLRMMPDDDSGV